MRMVLTKVDPGAMVPRPAIVGRIHDAQAGFEADA